MAFRITPKTSEPQRENVTFGKVFDVNEFSELQAVAGDRQRLPAQSLLHEDWNDGPIAGARALGRTLRYGRAVRGDGKAA